MIRKLIVILLTGTLCLIGITPVLAKGYATLAEYEKLTGNRIEKFNEAPMLRTLVAAGKLPPVEERLPEKDDIYVVEPIEKIGQYGGTIRTTTLTPEGYGDDNNLSIFTSPVKPTPDASSFIPEVAKDLVPSADYTVWTIHLRRGMKWSDGHPFTADDIMFWYEDVLLNKELTPIIGVPWKEKGEGLVKVEKVDDYTVKFKFPTPRPYFINRATHMGAWDLYLPKHYLKQFHPKYTPEKELEKKVKEAGFDNWWELFGKMNSHVWGQSTNPDRPTLAPYVMVQKTADRRVWQRNPYYWKVDTAGNQLPYLDGIVTKIVTNLEVVQGMIISGEIDFAGMQATIENYPMYKRNEKKGNYRIVLWTSGMGSDVIYMVNLTHRDPILRKIFQDVRFRRALSLAINRQEINRKIYFGKAQPRQYTNIESSQYFEPEFATAYIEYNPERAKALLNEMGLFDKDGDGFLERPDGKKLGFTIEYYEIETPKKPNVELVSQYWREIGIDVKVKPISGELAGQRAPANLMDCCLWHGDKATDVLFPIQPQFRVPTAPGWERTIWPAWARWFQTDGEAGEEPPDNIKELHNWWKKMLKEPDLQKRIELGKKILRSQAENLWCIGTIGKSPYPIILNKNLRNFPETGLWVWDTSWSCTRDPSQIFFEK
ncbi:ABC transporter substrate-binding protein [Candidatus Aerophobetes bacterium]|nr:ABC transporter substrate-binding protein [Candidatus Aerophobetes bacterium]